VDGGTPSDAPTVGEKADQFGNASRTKTLVFYGVTIVAAVVLVKILLVAGAHAHAPRAASGSAAAGGKAPTTEHFMWRLLLASAVIIVVSRLVGGLFRWINQPQVVGEIVAGVMLGPSLLGSVWPHAAHALFSAEVLPHIDVLAQIGLIFFMFLIGLELDVRLIRGRGHAATAVSHVSIIVPFLLGCAVALVLFPTVGSANGHFTPFALFLGASMSITAFPVLARILAERGLAKTRLGTVTLTCAAVDDVTAWCLLAVVVAIARAHGVGSALVTIGLSAGFIVLMILVVRPVMARLADWQDDRGGLGSGMLAGLFVGVLLSALATDRIGIHAIFGAFLFGAVMPQRSHLIREVVGKLEDFIGLFLLPLFFAFTGLRTQIGLLGSDATLWALCGLVLLVAVVGKWGGSAVAARVVGLEWRESMALGILMNTRGLTELIILNIGLDLGVIPPALFAMLVIMALVTTFMTTPILSLTYRQADIDRMVAEETGEGEPENEDGPGRFRVLVPLPGPQRAHELVHTAMRLAREHDEDAEIILLRVVRLPGSAYRGGPLAQESMVERATHNLRAMVAMVEGAGHKAVPLVVPAADVSQAIAQVAEARRPDLVLMSWHNSPFGRRILGGHVGDVLRAANADVAVLVDPAQRGIHLPKGARILVPWGGGFHEDVGIDLALRLAQASGATIELLGGGDEARAHDLAERAAEAYEGTGVWAAPVPVEGDVLAALIERSADVDLVVLGVSDTWIHDQHSLGELREALAARAMAPLLIVRRHGQRGRRGPNRWLRRQREWIELEPAH
jgi:Kef-type K+ transport system membrane component KefB/nucleotide-binding universal stress UspA family protein